MIRSAAFLLLFAGTAAFARPGVAPMHTATGTFEVKLTPLGAPEAPIGAMSIAKVFHGDLDATSAGEMLAVRTPVEGSAGYVAIERVSGTLAGRHGSFALQHSGTMARGVQSLTVTIVPDSGTDGLAGISGSLAIAITSGQHRYSLRYALPE